MLADMAPMILECLPAADRRLIAKKYEPRSLRRHTFVIVKTCPGIAALPLDHKHVLSGSENLGWHDVGTFDFQPGDPGFDIHDTFVYNILEDGQAKAKGVVDPCYIRSINGESFRREHLSECIAGSARYTLTFHRPNHGSDCCQLCGHADTGHSMAYAAPPTLGGP